jgi:hypothetical protein
LRGHYTFYKVYNYKDILPQDLIHDLLEFHIVPNIKPKTDMAPSRNKFNLNSTLIESRHIPLFSSWIDKKESSHYNKTNNPYEFKLLHRSSRDGFDHASFHRNCDNKGATICVVKVQGSEQLVGIYNPLDWSGNNIWKQTADSFLFNFTDGKNISTAELSNSNNTQYSVYCGNNNGPYTNDLKNSYNGRNDWSYCANGAYKHRISIPANFSVEDYEVFQVIRR